MLDTIHEHEIPKPTGTFESMVEYDRRRSTKERLLNQVIATCLDHTLAIGALRGMHPAQDAKEDSETAGSRTRCGWSAP